MDPQKLPDANRTPDNTNLPPTPGTDISMSEESLVKPGAVVVGGEPSQATPEPTATPSTPDQPDRMAAFMREPETGVLPAPAAGKKKLGLIALIVAAVLVLFGGAAAYYFAYMVPNKPDNILKAALVNSFSKEKVQSFAFDGSLAMTDENGDSLLSATVSGAASQEGPITLSGSVDAVVTNITFDLRSVDGKIFYAKVGGLSGLPEILEQSGDTSLSVYAPLLTAIDEQWYEINASLIEQFTGSSSATGTLSEADMQKLTDAYKKHSFLTVKETLASEEINGVDSHHYLVAIDKTKLKDFVTAIKDANIESLGFTQEMYDGFLGGIDGVDLTPFAVEVWIAKDSKLFTKMAYTVENEGLTLAIQVTLKDYNKSVTVEKPEGAQSILEVISGFYEVFTGGSLPTELEDANGLSL